jgi:hypothetical protein
MTDEAFFKRMKASAQDFWGGVRPAIESQFKATVLPLEQLQETQVVKAFDHVGIDAFYLDRQGSLKGLASRVNWGRRFEHAPAFTLRYGLWNARGNNWGRNCEYQRKLEAIDNPKQFIFFPHIHVESFSQKKGSGLITWSYVARTEDILNYVRTHLPEQNKKKAYTFVPTYGERREVVVVNINGFAKNHKVTEVKINR